jgi:hypothetical protein
MTTITAKFLAGFDVNNEKHVLWFKRMCDVADSFNDPNKAVTLVAEINMNPMKVVLDHRDALDWAHIHFCLAFRYAKAVVAGDAWIPPKPAYKVTGV